MKNYFKLSIALMMVVAIATSCSDDEPGGEKVKPRVDIVLTKSESVVNNAAAEFGIKIINPVNKYAELNEKINWSVSPLSASEVLGLMANGANGETLEQLCDLMGVKDVPLADVNSYYKNVKKQLLEVDNTAKVNLANALFIDDRFSLLPDFMQLCNDYYDALINFASFDEETTWIDMDKWVSEQTNAKVQNRPQILEEYARIINAMYFKGVWAEQFDKAVSEKFYPNYPNESYFVNVQMMKKYGNYGYARSEHFEACEIAYGNGAFSMVVMLPIDDTDINEQLTKLTCEEYASLIDDIDVHKMSICLPKWESECEIDLAKVITAERYNKIFELTSDYSKLSGDGICFLSSFQNNYIKVDETGTEAASSTISSDINIAPLPNPDYVFNVNRPFFYLIKEKSTGAILLMGKVSKIG